MGCTRGICSIHTSTDSRCWASGDQAPVGVLQCVPAAFSSFQLHSHSEAVDRHIWLETKQWGIGNYVSWSILLTTDVSKSKVRPKETINYLQIPQERFMVALPMKAIIRMLSIWACWTASYSNVGCLFSRNLQEYTWEGVCRDWNKRERGRQTDRK